MSERSVKTIRKLTEIAIWLLAAVAVISLMDWSGLVPGETAFRLSEMQGQ